MAEVSKTYDPKNSNNMSAFTDIFKTGKPKHPSNPAQTTSEVPIPPALRQTVEQPTKDAQTIKQDDTPAKDQAREGQGGNNAQPAKGKRQARKKNAAKSVPVPSRENKKSWTVWCDAQKFDDHKFMMFVGGYRTAEELLDEFHRLWIKEHGSIPRR